MPLAGSQCVRDNSKNFGSIHITPGAMAILNPTGRKHKLIRSGFRVRSSLDLCGRHFVVITSADRQKTIVSLNKERCSCIGLPSQSDTLSVSSERQAALSLGVKGTGRNIKNSCESDLRNCSLGTPRKEKTALLEKFITNSFIDLRDLDHIKIASILAY